MSETRRGILHALSFPTIDLFLPAMHLLHVNFQHRLAKTFSLLLCTFSLGGRSHFEAQFRISLPLLRRFAYFKLVYLDLSFLL